MKNKLPSTNEEAMLELPATDGMLLKHPVAVGKDFVLLDFKETEWKVKLIG